MRLEEINLGDRLIHKTCECGKACGHIATVLEVDLHEKMVSIRRLTGQVMYVSPHRLEAIADYVDHCPKRHPAAPKKRRAELV